MRVRRLARPRLTRQSGCCHAHVSTVPGTVVVRTAWPVCDEWGGVRPGRLGDRPQPCASCQPRGGLSQSRGRANRHTINGHGATSCPCGPPPMSVSLHVPVWLPHRASVATQMRSLVAVGATVCSWFATHVVKLAHVRVVAAYTGGADSYAQVGQAGRTAQRRPKSPVPRP